IMRLEPQRQLQIMLEPLSSPDIGPTAHHSRAEVSHFQVARMLECVCSEAVSIIKHLLAKLVHGAAMLMPGDGAGLVNEGAAVADSAGHDVQIAAAARHAADIQCLVESAHSLQSFAALTHVHALAEPAGP